MPMASDTAELKHQVISTVASLAPQLIDLSEQVRHVPELGFDEVRTSELASQWLEGHMPQGTAALARTGFRAEVAGLAPGPTIALLGELDAVHVPSHPDANPETGAAHACGHEASLAAACGAAAAVASVMPQLAGRLVFIGTPAEEILPDDARLQMQTSGGPELPTGKSELIRLGVFDDVDMAMMVHAGRESGPRFSVGDTLNGAVRVTAHFRGSAAHAGSSPWLGVDAVRAARLAMDAVDAQKDTFPDSEVVRIAQQLAQPSTAAGATPATCRLELLVRAKSLETLELAMEKVDRALYAGAVAIGAGLTRTKELTYLPHRSSRALDDIVRSNATEIVGEGEQARGRHLGACSDIGDLSMLMPVSHPYASGAVGQHHSPTFHIQDHHQATIEPATYLAMALVDLLSNDAHGARDVLEAEPPGLTRENYLKLHRRMAATRDTWPQLTTRSTDDRD